MIQDPVEICFEMMLVTSSQSRSFLSLKASFWTCVVVILKNLASIHIRYTLGKGVGVIWSRSYMVFLNIYLVLNIYLSYIFKIKQIPTHLLLRPIKYS